jgi:hypothetical protein
MVKAQLRAAQTLEATHLFPTMPIIPSGYSLKFQRIKFPFRLRVEIPISLKEHLRVSASRSRGGEKMISF